MASDQEKKARRDFDSRKSMMVKWSMLNQILNILRSEAGQPLRSASDNPYISAK